MASGEEVARVSSREGVRASEEEVTGPSQGVASREERRARSVARGTSREGLRARTVKLREIWTAWLFARVESREGTETLWSLVKEMTETMEEDGSGNR